MKDPYQEYIKNSSKSARKRQSIQGRGNGQRILNRYFSEETQMAKKITERCSTFLVIRETKQLEQEWRNW